MRTMLRTLASIGIIAVLSGTAVLACSSSAEDCEKTNTCTGGPGSGSGTGGGNTVDDCVPDPAKDPIAATCGIFLSTSGTEDSKGTQDAPASTFARAIELSVASVAKVKRIYVCAEEFTEEVTVPSGIAIYGGLDCNASWKHIGATTKTTLKAMPDKIPLTLAGGEAKTYIADLSVKAADATLPGGSSVAVIVDGAIADLVSCDFEAGAGLDGDKGATPVDPVGPADTADMEIRGNNGVNACSKGTSDTDGGEAKINPYCSPVGGKGGAGMVAGGANGEDGQPLPVPNPNNKGIAGLGETATLECTDGGKGQIGTDGTHGAGATGLGTLSIVGFAGAPGLDGTLGVHGQGGGGGGGAKGKSGCSGASGGGGGAGGCGGHGGKGGQAGGASIALISLNATLTFAGVNLTASVGGKGGDGGDGQSGGAGGIGGVAGSAASGTTEACAGGKGGTGGFGGKGGGGRGGHSIAIAYMGTAPPSDGVKPASAEPGVGGLGFNDLGNGQAGVKAEMQEF